MGGIPALAPLFQGTLTSYKGVLQLPDSTLSAQPLQGLLSSSTLNEVLTQHEMSWQCSDRRALLSLWSQYYFSRLLPPVLAANLIMDWALPLALESMKILMDDRGLPAAFVLPHGGKSFESGPSPTIRFRELHQRHLVPLVKAWSFQVRLSERVFWGNAGRYIAWILTELPKLGQPSAVWLPLYEWLNTPVGEDGKRHSLYGLYHYCRCSELKGKSLHRVRRTCCLRYRLPKISPCSDCPRLCRTQW